MQKGLKLIASHFWLLRRMSGAWTRLTAAVIVIIFLVSLFVALTIVHNGIYQIGLRLISPQAFAAAPVVALGFNEGSGSTTADASGNNNTGTLLGGVTWTTAGKYGKALSFNGSSGVVRIPDSPSWKENGLTGYTVSMWVKVKNVSGDYKIALGKGAWPSDDIIINKFENTWSYGIRTTDWSCGGSTTALPYLTTVDNTYHHIAVSMNASAGQCQFYADGQIVHTDEFVSGTTVFATGAGLNNLYIGGLDGGQYLNADIDEVRIYKTALTQAEIQTDMNTPIGGAPPGDTTPPVISGVAAGSIAATSATITWTTNENSDSQVEYGVTTAYGQSTTLNPALVTAHSQGLSGLTAGTLYHYRVKSRDAAGNLAVSGDFSFTTATAGDTTPPVISVVAAGSITTTSATITWTTNENSDSQVEYGLTTAYGQSTTLNPALVTAHLQGLSGLTVGTLYHYRVKSRDAAGNLAVSADFSFTTAQGTSVPLTRLREYVYAVGRLITSEEKSCVPALSPAGASLPQGGGTGSVSVSTPSECSWVATSSAGWITVTSGSSGSGSGSVGYSVTANSGAQRSGAISISGQAFTITQAPNSGSCSYALNKNSELISEQGGSGSFTLTTGAGCAWSASSNAGWLTITSAPSGNGPATITYSVAANAGGQRSGAITVGRQTLTITQAPNQASCSFALSPGSQSFDAGGGNGSFTVTTGAGCLWNAATADGWITITGGATGTGNGAVSFTVQTNNDGSRTGAISVRGQVFTVTQCGYVVSPTSFSLGSNGGTRSINVSSVAAGCSSDAGPNAIRPQQGAPRQWLVSLLVRAGLAFLIACGVLSLLLRIDWRQARRRFAIAAAGIVLRIRDQIIWLGAVMRLGKQKLVRLLLERVRTIAGKALSLRRSLSVARLKLTLRRALVIAIIVILALPVAPAQADGIVRAAQTIWREARAYIGGARNRPIKIASVRRLGNVVSAASQAEQVTDLQVCPSQLIMFVGERYTLTPIALNSTQQVVHGVGMSWSSHGPAIAKVSSFGQVEAVAVGTTAVEVQCGAASKQIPIEVRSGTRPTGSNQQADIDPTNDCAAEQSSAFAPKSAAAADAQQSLISENGVMLDWDPAPLANSLATHFRNAVGNPRFTARSQSAAAVPTSAQLGSSSYQFNVPVVSVGGRGVSADVSMTMSGGS